MSDITQQPARLTYEDVQIRPAEVSDRISMEAIAAGTWEGHDYLPKVLDQWFADDSGIFSVMVYQDEVVALGKLSHLDEGEWWLEGLRVSPSMRGRGAARIMHHYMVAQARQHADGVVRFSTAASNQAVAKLATETGFQLMASYAPFEIQVQKVDNAANYWQLTPENLPQLREWLNRSDYFAAAQESFEFLWKWRLVTDSILNSALIEKRVYGWNPDADTQSLKGLLIMNPLYQNSDGETVLSIAFGDTVADLRLKFWKDVAVFAGSVGANYAHIKVADLTIYTDLLVEAGWEAEEIRPVLYSRPIQMTTDSEVQYETIPAIE